MDVKKEDAVDDHGWNGYTPMKPNLVAKPATMNLVLCILSLPYGEVLDLLVFIRDR